LTWQGYFSPLSSDSHSSGVICDRSTFAPTIVGVCEKRREEKRERRKEERRKKKKKKRRKKCQGQIEKNSKIK